MAFARQVFLFSLLAGLASWDASSCVAFGLPACTPEVKYANEAFERGDYKEALVYYKLLLNRQRNERPNRNTELAAARKGLCLLYLGDSQQALEAFHDYLLAYGRGRFYSDIRAAVETIYQSQPLGAKTPPRVDLEQRIQELVESLEEPPRLDQRAKLMNLYWKTGRYDAALEQFEAITDASPGYFQELDTVYVVSRALVAHVPSATDVLLKDIRVRDDVRDVDALFGDRPTLILTAAVENRTGRPLDAAEFGVTLFDAAGEELDSKPLRITALADGGKQPVELRFDGLDTPLAKDRRVQRLEIELVGVYGTDPAAVQ